MWDGFPKADIEGDVLQHANADEFRHWLKHNLASNENRKLRQHKSISLSLAISWNRVQTAANLHGVTCTEYASEVHAFFSEAKSLLNSEIPRWWKEAVLNPRGYSSGFIFNEVSKIPVRLQNRISLRRADTFTEVSVVGESYKFRVYAPCERVAHLKSEGGIFYAPYSFTANPFDIHQFDPVKGTSKWTSKVWGNGSAMNYGPTFTQFAELQMINEVLTIFGISWDAAYIEGFDPDTGKAVFRFSTVYSSY